ncbi:hypothetical protein HOE39_01675 [Candidatus Woesearchaeota archaeon]|jgi:type I restriction enzyme, S subunit|nr:hypothetical protein [Candidatus Woesearchaeota archaeon]
MMEGWKEYKLKDVFHFYNGKAVSANAFGKYPIYGSNGQIGYTDEYKFRNSIIIGRVGAYCGAVFYEKDKFWASDNTIVVNNKEGFDIEFLSYLISLMNLNWFAGGSAQPLLTHSWIKPIKVTMPEFPTQRKIAKILSAYDNLIANNLKRIKLLEEIAQKTYEEWFVFRKIDNELIDDSQIEFQNLEELIADYMNGGWGKEVEEGSYTVPAYVIRGTDMPDISSGSFNKLPLRFHTNSNFKSRELQSGDVIIEMSNGNINNVGRSFYYDRDFNKLIEHPAMCASFCKMLRPKTVELSYIVDSHINYIYETNRMLVYKSQAANGINNFRFEDMISDEVLSIPKGKLISKLVATLKPKYELISKVRNQIRLLKEARDILLPRLMTGMIDVEKLELEL